MSRVAEGHQVWSLPQFYSVDFSQSRIGVKKCVFNKGTIKVCVSCFDGVLGQAYFLAIFSSGPTYEYAENLSFSLSFEFFLSFDDFSLEFFLSFDYFS